MNQRGILYPERLPKFRRIAAEPSLRHAVQWFWIAEWDLPPGVTSRQELLPFPACNIAVEPTGVTIVGPPTQRSERILEARGWVVGALLLPAAAHEFFPRMTESQDLTGALDEPGLHGEVSRWMSGEATDSDEHVDRAAAVLGSWICERVPVPAPTSEAHLANELSVLLADPEITRVDQLPARLHVSARSLHRIAERYFGIAPHAMIRRRRLQEAAARLRVESDLRLAELASELGYTDHAHFSKDFAAVLGMTPREYRAGAGPSLAE